MSGKAPAWQVREMQRQQLLERLMQQIIRQEDAIGLEDLHEALLFLLQMELKYSRVWVSVHFDLSLIRTEVKQKVCNLFGEMEDEVKKFSRSQEEGKGIYAKLFEWVASEIVRPYHAALHTQELHEPKKIYGIEDRTAEIPFE